MEIFINNLNGEMSYQLQLQCPPTFEKLIKNEMKIEDALVKRGVLKIYNDNNLSKSSNHEKPKFWQKYKTNNQGSSNETQNAKPVFNLSRTTSKTNLTTNPNIASQNIDQNDPQSNDSNKTNDAIAKKFPYFT